MEMIRNKGEDECTSSMTRSVDRSGMDVCMLRVAGRGSGAALGGIPALTFSRCCRHDSPGVWRCVPHGPDASHAGAGRRLI